MDQAIEKIGAPILAIFTALALSGCFDSDESGNPSSSSFVNVPGGVAASPAEARNNRPSISGNPGAVAVIGSNWSFTPSASDQDGDALSFSITNKPNWAEFNASTGSLSGRPRPGQEGNYSDIGIAVSDGEELAELTAFAIVVQETSANSAPTIAGSPPSSGTVGQDYSFTPLARDADNDRLIFAIANKPNWANFNTTTGELSGMPQPGDSAFYDNIVVSVSDGTLISSLPAFAITVAQVGNNAVTLRLVPPTENEDGTPLTDLSAYKIYYGVSEGSYPNEITIDNPGITNYVVENLTPDTYFFVSTSVNSNGRESDYSNVYSKLVN